MSYMFTEQLDIVAPLGSPDVETALRTDVAVDNVFGIDIYKAGNFCNVMAVVLEWLACVI